MTNEKGGSTITDMLQSRAGLAAIIVALTSLLLIQPSPLNSERPSAESGGNKSSGAAQDVDARLWQDPFQAVNNATKSTAASSLEIKAYDGKKLTVELVGSKKQNDHLAENIYSELPGKTDGKQITLMAVMMSASPTPEEHEARLRRRYALVSALANREYAPVDAEHIGYFKTDNSKNKNLPEIVPFEWFENANEDKLKRVLVLWIDDTRFDSMPVTKTLELFNQATPTSKIVHKDKITRVVMGPSSSGNLRAIAFEMKDWGNKKEYGKNGDSNPGNIMFYSSQATTADCKILNGIISPCEPSRSESTLTRYLSKRHIQLVRTIADDDKVVASLVEELKSRRVKHSPQDNQKESADTNTQGDHIVLLSDWDTLYGRTLPLAFEKAYEKEETPKCSSLDNTDEHVHCFKYVRGIDGILPGPSRNNDAKTSPQTKPESSSSTSVTVDRPDGMSQKDYLRRIVEEIRKLDDRLLQNKLCLSPVNRCGVAAIGVLGYDVYDKLMILRALRPYFPNKIFFTTDLSASYWSHEEIPYSHNLLVESSFGLDLNPKQQKDIPPFRDSYQTAFFFSTLLALDSPDIIKKANAQEKSSEEKLKIITDLKDKLIGEPRIFEIGRKGPVDLTKKNNSIDSEKRDCADELSSCLTIHPASIFDRSHADYETLFKLILSACGFVLLYLASWNVRRWVNHIFLKNEKEVLPSSTLKFIRKFHWKRTGITLCFILLFVLAIRVIASHSDISEEPWLWLEGVSIWPSELLRLIALIASLVLLHDAFQRIRKSDEDIATAFGFKVKEEKEQASPDSEPAQKHDLGLLNNCSSVHKWQSTKKDKTWLSKTTLNGLEGQVINVNQLWKEYRRTGERKRRVCRSLIGIALFMIFAWSSIVLSGGLPTPARGDFAFDVDLLLIVLVLPSILFLTMLVVDASRLCAAFISHLDEAQSDYLTGIKNPSCTMIHLSNQWGLKPAHTAYWLDAQFVAQRTEVIQKLIWYPVIPIFLLAVARSPVFDDWSHPAGLIATLAILIVYLISCAFLLEYGAKKMRLKATKHLGAELRKLRGSFGSGDNPKIDRLENLIKEIEGLKQGAFLPLFQQPWVEAVLAMASGAGGLAWMGNLLGTP